jgi:hypothetical protein
VRDRTATLALPMAQPILHFARQYPNVHLRCRAPLFFSISLCPASHAFIIRLTQMLLYRAISESAHLDYQLQQQHQPWLSIAKTVPNPSRRERFIL